MIQLTSVPYYINALPEILLFCWIGFLILQSVLIRQHNQAGTYVLSLLGLAALFVITVPFFSWPVMMSFHGLFVRDPLSIVLKLCAFVVTGAVFIYSRDYILKRNIAIAEFYILSLFSLLGVMVLCSANSLITVYLGIELMALPVYAMVAIRRESALGAEASMKYFVTGALATGMILYAMSLIYGFTGTLIIPSIGQIIATGHVSAMGEAVAMVFLLAGIGFKFGLFPFHMWVPDVYEGAPTAVTAYLSSVPKLGAFVLVVRLLQDLLPNVHSHWAWVLMGMGLSSLIVGNLSAIVQTNMKRLLAYSAIGQLGFVFIAFALPQPLGDTAALYYLLVYVVTTVAAFGVLMLISKAGVECENIEDLAGLNSRSPWLALCLLLILLSLMGIPPLVGFDIKLMVIAALVHREFYIIASGVLIFTVIAGYYYLRVIKTMYFDQPPKQAHVPAPSTSGVLVLSINSFLLLFAGLFPAGVMHLCHMIFYTA